VKLDELETLAKSATPGPWRQCTAPDTNNTQAVCDHFFEFIARTDIVSIHSTEACEANARYIAAASPDVILSLLARLKRAEAVCEAARPVANRWRKHGVHASDVVAMIAALDALDGGNDEG
jgi:hypothetical protein